MVQRSETNSSVPTTREKLASIQAFERRQLCNCLRYGTCQLVRIQVPGVPSVSRASSESAGNTTHKTRSDVICPIADGIAPVSSLSSKELSVWKCEQRRLRSKNSRTSIAAHSIAQWTMGLCPPVDFETSAFAINEKSDLTSIRWERTSV